MMGTKQSTIVRSARRGWALGATQSIVSEERPDLYSGIYELAISLVEVEGLLLYEMFQSNPNSGDNKSILDDQDSTCYE